MKTMTLGEIREAIAGHELNRPAIFQLDVDYCVIHSVTTTLYKTESGVLLSEEEKITFVRENPEVKIEYLLEPIFRIELEPVNWDE